jgi:hypothetical protein
MKVTKKSDKSNKQTLDNSIKKAVGRPKDSGIKYNPKIYPDIVKSLLAKGYVESQIQEIIHISVATFNSWKKKYPEFVKALKEGKQGPIDRTVNTLEKVANGFKETVKKAIVVSDGAQIGSHIEMVDIEEYIPPQVSAIRYYLNNRDKDNWSDKQNIEINGKMEYKVIPDDELEEKE